MRKERKLGAIILAAGQGKRMQVDGVNKVTLHLDNKPIIAHIVDFTKRMDIASTVVVIGHAKESVIQILEKEHVLFAEQIERLGTGHALQIGLSVLPEDITDVLVVYGDDAVFYNDKHVPVMEELFREQLSSDAAFTFLTIEQDNPAGLGRIVRDNNKSLLAIIESKDATEEQLKIKEINPGCFVFSVDFLRKYLPKVVPSPVTGEYYLTSLIDLAIQDRLKVQTVRGGTMAWRGVNTKEELAEAERLFEQLKNR
ncbi:MAG TPA: NTP transferase domain-containing protein [Candidatus Sulfotelmatobacter sp.]|jgi:bifunctional UDP-N-acetylglucosamine pyrophosphorylase/glucosamine-1-phosphate N-acetyltransferase|nr:NTP transferase domain-containing protein [Candidatus Sulfotelmatobacter sp.]